MVVTAKAVAMVKVVEEKVVKAVTVMASRKRGPIYSK